MDVLFASHNQNKLKEIKELLKGTDINIISLSDLNDLDMVHETGETFQENAIQKAKYFYDKYKMPTISDDSGLIVDSLDGKPGVFSARYAGNNATDQKNNKMLLYNMRNVANRKGYFLCIVCYISNGNYYLFEGKLDGTIAEDIKGDKGFGYDPLFVVKDGTRLSQLDTGTKNKISHRANALRKWLEFVLIKEQR